MSRHRSRGYDDPASAWSPGTPRTPRSGRRRHYGADFSRNTTPESRDRYGYELALSLSGGSGSSEVSSTSANTSWLVSDEGDSEGSAGAARAACGRFGSDQFNLLNNGGGEGDRKRSSRDERPTSNRKGKGPALGFEASEAILKRYACCCHSMRRLVCPMNISKITTPRSSVLAYSCVLCTYTPMQCACRHQRVKGVLQL